MWDLWLRDDQSLDHNFLDIRPYLICLLGMITLRYRAFKPVCESPLVHLPVEVLVLLIQGIVCQVLEMVVEVIATPRVFLRCQADESIFENHYLHGFYDRGDKDINSEIKLIAINQTRVGNVFLHNVSALIVGLFRLFRSCLVAILRSVRVNWFNIFVPLFLHFLELSIELFS